MAAKTLKGITVEINGKTTGLANALKDVTKTSTALSSNLKEINKALKLDPGNTELLNEKQRILSESVAAARKELETLEGVQKQVSDQYANGDIDRGAWLEYQNKLQKAKQHLEDLEKAQKDFGTAAAQTIKEAGAKIEEYGGKVSKVGETLTKNVTTPLTAAAAAGVAAFSAVDEGVDTIVTATGASGEALDGLVASYETIATSIPEELGDVASAVGEVNTRFHTTGEELEGQTTLFLQFAKITGGDVVSSVDSADKVLKTFGKTSDDASGLLGMVAKAAQDTGINAQGLMDDVLANSATFKELNFSLEESVNFMALLDENGVESGVALAGLKKAVVNLTDAGMSESEALQTVIDKIKNAGSETEALTIAQETFGTKGAAEMATAIREGRLSLDGLSASMADYSTVVTDTYNNTMDGVDGATTAANAAKIAMSTLGETISDMLAPIFQHLTQLLIDAKARFDTLDDGQKQAIVTIGLIVAAIGPALVIIGKVITAVGTITTGVGSLVGFVGGTVVPLITGTIMPALSGLWALMLANPISIVIAAIAAIVAAFVLLWNKCEGFRNFWINLFSSVKSTVVDAKNNVLSTFDGIKNGISSRIEGAKNSVHNAIENIKGFFNFSWSLPHLQLPHPYISGRFSLNPPSVPSFGINWYKEGGILSGAQIFGQMGGNLLGGGEAGQEAVLPLSDFYDHLDGILSRYMNNTASGLVIQLNIERFENGGSEDIKEIARRVGIEVRREVEKKRGAFE
ncbi:phage tail tape measure protein [Gemmiger formicilis]